MSYDLNNQSELQQGEQGDAEGKGQQPAVAPGKRTLTMRLKPQRARRQAAGGASGPAAAQPPGGLQQGPDTGDEDMESAAMLGQPGGGGEQAEQADSSAGQGSGGQSSQAASSGPSNDGPEASESDEQSAQGSDADLELGRSEGVTFQAAGEEHTLWVDDSGGRPTVMVASTPTPVPTRLRTWKKKADKMENGKLKTNILGWIQKSWEKYNLLQTAAAGNANDSMDTHKSKMHDAQNNLKTMISQLFWAFKVDISELGAVAVYRGLHFSTDWDQKRPTAYNDEINRDFDSVRDEGTFSSASYQIAIERMKQQNPNAGSYNPSREQLESATGKVMQEVRGMQQTTDFNRTDQSQTGKDVRKRRENFERGKEKYEGDNTEQGQQRFNRMSTMLEEQEETDKGRYTRSGNAFNTQFEGALSRYIDNQSLFEDEMAEEDGEYDNISFSQIPFISTSKSAAEAVKYAQGKLAGNNQRSNGTVGRVLVYVAPKTAMMEAGGIDVWEELGKGNLTFTEWRKNENEITFSGTIPDEFMRGMTMVQGNESVEDAAAKAELEAQKHATAFGGLNALPLNQDH